jgi:hypothetical protein
MNAIDVLLLHFDHAYAHPYESLSSALEGLGEEEAAFSAPCYADTEPEPGWPAPGSAWWHVAHLAHCKRYYARLVEERGSTRGLPVSVRTPTASYAEEQKALAAAHEAQRAAIVACTDDDLTTTVATGTRLDEFLAMTIRHDAWHAAQIALARRLWRTRG